ncbi:hypothetical protein ROSINTL182_06355 [Roseburia intestinalis L1-82]|uniref:Uncharacterized protein n=1 Tax=Roseburia intestinalis L1-82 TaxID=536231 RepID=C7G8X9_9FIRM|nr:hypothetical protein ROSINTL182_06355 [Roseburia intestinalis L1-82]
MYFDTTTYYTLCQLYLCYIFSQFLQVFGRFTQICRTHFPMKIRISKNCRPQNLIHPGGSPL